MHECLQDLPAAIASETATALEPLATCGRYPGGNMSETKGAIAIAAQYWDAN